ncbi:MAG: Stp1/IreP family PP2C-type Ser/Thr phosphatase [Methylophilaceae bacterium]|nr:Stp1/IreP family PP2C-type Ser/Thr phosphatase [Methylophilaceae bacterium]
MNMREVLQVVRQSDVGKLREHNEDAIASDATIGLLVLADGMGGYKAGEVASELAVLTVVAMLTEALKNHTDDIMQDIAAFDIEMASKAMIHAVKKANEVVYQVSQNQAQCAGMGTTLVVCLLTDNKMVVGHIGDSRLYRLRHGVLQQMTEDHSLLQEQLNLGLITAEQAKYSNNKNLVTRALGIEPQVELEVHEYPVQVEDIYLLCSDGLSDLVDDEDICFKAVELSANLDLMAEKLIKMANDNGGKDNISVVIAKVTKAYPNQSSKLQRFLDWLK